MTRIGKGSIMVSRITLLLWMHLLVVALHGFVIPNNSASPRRRVFPFDDRYQNSLRLSSVDLPRDATSRNRPDVVTRWETWYMEKLTGWYREALVLKCPFFRRRVSDVLDTVDYVFRLPYMGDTSVLGLPLAYQCEGDVCIKSFGLSLNELAVEIRKDWREDTRKGYYITGKLNTGIYRDDCLFDGPDPDMPVRGLRKYLNAASQLFDPAKSTCELLSLHIQDNVIVAEWRMKGRLRLPWKPWMPTVTGRTTYHTDESGLIREHGEVWDISVFRAFMQTLLPEVGGLIWKDDFGGVSDPTERIEH
jgi:hypothetical protein